MASSARTTLTTKAKGMALQRQRGADSPSEGDIYNIYERNIAFLSDWIEASLQFQTISVRATHQTHYHYRRQFSPSVPDLPLPVGTQRRRLSNDGGANNNDEAMNSLEPLFHEHHQSQIRPSPSQMSPCCLGAVLYEESTNSGAGGSRGIRPLPFGARPTATQQPALARERV